MNTQQTLGSKQKSFIHIHCVQFSRYISRYSIVSFLDTNDDNDNIFNLLLNPDRRLFQCNFHQILISNVLCECVNRLPTEMPMKMYDFWHPVAVADLTHRNNNDRAICPAICPAICTSTLYRYTVCLSAQHTVNKSLCFCIRKKCT